MPTSAIDPAQTTMQLLARFGPWSESPPPTLDESLRYVRALARTHYENFSVLTALVPHDLRDDFGAVYAFCRWSDDLADETGDDDDARARSLELLRWWRAELHRCFEGEARHPVFIALARTVARHDPPRKPFDDLIDAFEQDQSVRSYDTWDRLLDYCSRSADPVGRIVLHMAGYPECAANRRLYEMSDATCTALQLTNFWQDVRRDLLERARVYLPSEETGIDTPTLRDWADRPQDPEARVPFILALRPLVERTHELFERGRPLPKLIDPAIRPVVWLFGAGGARVLDAVERSGCTTLWHRPTLTGRAKAALVARAWAISRIAALREAAP